jgi:hypothetical protein
MQTTSVWLSIGLLAEISPRRPDGPVHPSPISSTAWLIFLLCDIRDVGAWLATGGARW